MCCLFGVAKVFYHTRAPQLEHSGWAELELGLRNRSLIMAWTLPNRLFNGLHNWDENSSPVLTGDKDNRMIISSVSRTQSSFDANFTRTENEARLR